MITDLSIGKMKKILARAFFAWAFSESSFCFMWRVDVRGRGTGHIIKNYRRGCNMVHPPWRKLLVTLGVNSAQIPVTKQVNSGIA
jgi:hypothetical protein